MSIPSKINSLSYVEFPNETPNGIQALINELERIKHNPNKQHLAAVNICAQHLAKATVIERFERIKGVYYNYDKRLWYAEKMTKGKLKVIKYSANRNEVISAYQEYVRNH